MKKLLTVVLSVALILSSLTLFACDSTFDGNYKEASAEEAQVFMAKAEGKESKVSVNSGIEYEIKIQSKYKADGKEESGKLTFSLKTTKGDDGLKAAAKMETESSATDGAIKTEVYATDNSTYVKTTAKGETAKIKIESNFNAYFNTLYKTIESFGGEAISEISEMLYAPKAVAAEFPEGGVKFYFDDGETSKKFKAEIDVEKDGMKVKGTAYIAFDADFNTIGTKVDISMSGENEEMTLYMVSKAYDGKVSLPSDLDTYKSGTDALAGLIG